MTELERRAALSVGQLVTYDTIRSGLVKCRIVGRTPGVFSTDPDRLVLKVTSHNAYAYPRGLVFETHAGPFVQAR